MSVRVRLGAPDIPSKRKRAVTGPPQSIGEIHCHQVTLSWGNRLMVEGCFLKMVLAWNMFRDRGIFGCALAFQANEIGSIPIGRSSFADMV